MKARKKSLTIIQYLLVSNDSSLVSTILPPVSLDNEVLEFVRCCPIDLLQLLDPIRYFEMYIKNAYLYGYEFNVVNIVDVDNYLPQFILLKQIKLIFLDGEAKEHLDLFTKMNEKEIPFTYYYFWGVKSKEFESSNIVTSPHDFIERLLQYQDLILEYMSVHILHNYLSVPTEFKSFNSMSYFVPTRNNYSTINRIIGNYCLASTTNEEEVLKMHNEVSAKAIKGRDTFERQNFLIDQIKKIDYFLHIAYREKILIPVAMSDSYLAPLIIILPFHNPDLKNLYRNQQFIDLLQIEQTENYINDIPANFQKEYILSATKLQHNRIKFLDNVAFLHSSFQSNPIVRLPAKGKSIYREFSFLGTKTFLHHNKPDVRSKLKKTIYAAGNAVTTKTMSTALQNIIKNRNGQVVGISDLPIEWILIDGIPLSFTHDVCRLPETSLHSLMAHYVQNQVLEYSIPYEIIKKTLVILGAHEKTFSKWHIMVEELSQQAGFKISYCFNLEDVKKAINDFKPEFLIFDCHGGYDEITNTTYLKIGDEILDGKYVVSNNLFAPLVFLSACGTAPTYGTIHPIATAFFEIGSKAVTSTLLPIAIDAGTILYLRILNNLAHVSSQPIHKNWVEFISHVNRTTIINESFRSLFQESPGSVEKLLKIQSKILVESMFFSRRRDLFLTIDKTISKLSKHGKSNFSQVIPEYLMYTTLGRADLIYFKSWKDKFIEKNFNKIDT